MARLCWRASLLKDRRSSPCVACLPYMGLRALYGTAWPACLIWNCVACLPYMELRGQLDLVAERGGVDDLFDGDDPGAWPLMTTHGRS